MVWFRAPGGAQREAPCPEARTRLFCVYLGRRKRNPGPFSAGQGETMFLCHKPSSVVFPLWSQSQQGAEGQGLHGAWGSSLTLPITAHPRGPQTCCLTSQSSPPPPCPTGKGGSHHHLWTPVPCPHGAIFLSVELPVCHSLRPWAVVESSSLASAV